MKVLFEGDKDWKKLEKKKGKKAQSLKFQANQFIDQGKLKKKWRRYGQNFKKNINNFQLQIIKLKRRFNKIKLMFKKKSIP